MHGLIGDLVDLTEDAVSELVDAGARLEGLSLRSDVRELLDRHRPALLVLAQLAGAGDVLKHDDDERHSSPAQRANERRATRDGGRS